MSRNGAQTASGLGHPCCSHMQSRWVPKKPKDGFREKENRSHVYKRDKMCRRILAVVSLSFCDLSLSETLAGCLSRGLDSAGLFEMIDDVHFVSNTD